LAAQLDVLVREATSTGDELRELARGIHPMLLVEGGLAPALDALAVRSAVPAILECRVEGRLPEQVEIAAYYGVSEALTNTAKHATASAIHIYIDTTQGEGIDTLQVQVRDDGRGGATLTGGTGLLGIKDRAEALGGRLLLHSPPDTGTTLRLELPLTTTNGDPTGQAS
jgi:signal transduction histidine kinase